MNVNDSHARPLKSGQGTVVGVLRVWLCLLLLPWLFACSSTAQIQTDLEYKSISLGPNDLQQYGIGFLTPAAATGQETDKQSLSLVFSNELEELRPDIRTVSLPQVLSSVNTQNLAEEYQQMYRDYLETGILEKSLLRRIGKANDVRYLAQLSLANFRQAQRGRFSLLGFRMVATQQANIRVFLQIWDSQTGTVAWEATQEVNYAYDTGKEAPVTFQVVAETASRKMFSALPGAVKQEQD